MGAPHRGVHLPFERWPDRDRAAWEELFVLGDIFDDDPGPGSHWSAQTRTTNLQHYARWLGWLVSAEELDPEVEPWDRATPERVSAFGRSLCERCAHRTVASAIIGLKCVLQRMHPDGEWRWLKDMTNRLDTSAKPSVDRREEVLDAREVFQGALRELERLAQRQPMTRTDQIDFRDALIIAVLVNCGLRMRNLEQIEIGTHLLRIGEGWKLEFGAHETKNGQPLRLFVAAQLNVWIEFYLEKVRPGFRIAPGCRRMWPGSKASPLSYDSLYARIVMTSRRLFGVAIAPHSFRIIIATALAEASPEDEAYAPAFLGHQHPAITRGYIKASRSKAGRRVNKMFSR